MNTARLAERFGLSATQARALEASGDFALTAGAGSGKTHTLTALVARDLVDGHIDPEDILVCTFTRAAAANVTARIEERLRALAPERSGEATLRLMCGTIDAVCQRLVQERSLDLSIPVSLSPGDERELVPIRAQAAGEVIADLDDEARAVLFAAFSPMPDRLGNEIQDVHDRAIRMRVDVNALHVPPASPPAQADIDHVISVIREILDDGRANPTATRKLSADLELLRGGKVMETNGRPGAVVAGLKPLLEEAKQGMLDLKQRVIDADLRPAALAIATALRLYDRRYRALKARAGIADFTDIAEHALELGTLPHPRRFRRVYVDEAQDTSPLQMEVLESLVAPGGALVPVGDANQSIYGFRDADVGVFLDLVEADDLGTVTLDENYRSQEPVLAAINALAERVLRPAGLDPGSTLARGARALVRMVPRAMPKDPPVIPPSVDVLYGLGEPYQMGAVDEARLAVPAILGRAGALGLGLSDIAVLCPTNRYLGIYSAELRRLGIPSLALQSGGLLDRPECLDLLAYLALLADPPDQTTFTRVVTSPIAGLSAPEVMSVLRSHAISRRDSDAGRVPSPAMDSLALTHPEVFNAHQRVTALVGRVPVAGIVRAIVEEHQYDLALEAADSTGAQLRNVERLIAAIGRVESRISGPSIRGVLDRLPEDDENVDLRVPAGVDAVRLMTVHGAKGLEFPLVAMTRLSWGPPPETGRALAGRDGSVGVARQGMSTSALIRARDERNLAQREERRRVAYVGITRAMEHLMLIGSGYVTTKGVLSWAGMAGMVFKEALDICEPLPPGATDLITIPGTDVAVRVTRLDPDHPVPAPAPPRAPVTGAEPAPGINEDDLTIPQPMAAGAISYSNLERWRKCGLRRYLERDLGLQPDGARTSTDSTGEDTLTAGDPGRDGREFGSLVHETLEHVDWSQGLGVATAVDDARRREAGRTGTRHLTPGDIANLAACLERAAAHPVARQLEDATEIRTEVPFATLIAGQLITGVIDVLATLPDGTALIVDWKTGDHFDEHDDDYDLQRRIYSLALLDMAGGPERVAARWVHLEGDGEQVLIVERPRADALRARLTRDIEATLTAVATNTTDIRDDRCLGCPGALRLCPAAAPPVTSSSG